MVETFQAVLQPRRMVIPWLVGFSVGSPRRHKAMAMAMESMETRHKAMIGHGKWMKMEHLAWFFQPVGHQLAVGFAH